MNVLLTSRPEVVFCNYVESAIKRHSLPWREEQHETEGRVIVAEDGAIVVVCDQDTDTRAIISFAEQCVHDDVHVTELPPLPNLPKNNFGKDPAAA